MWGEYRVEFSIVYLAVYFLCYFFIFYNWWEYRCIFCEVCVKLWVTKGLVKLQETQASIWSHKVGGWIQQGHWPHKKQSVFGFTIPKAWKNQQSLIIELKFTKYGHRYLLSVQRKQVFRMFIFSLCFEFSISVCCCLWSWCLMRLIYCLLNTIWANNLEFIIWNNITTEKKLFSVLPCKIMNDGMLGFEFWNDSICIMTCDVHASHSSFGCLISTTTNVCLERIFNFYCLEV